MTARYQAIKRVTLVSASVNAVLAAVKIFVGIVGRSPAVFADGIHSLSDLLGDALVFIAGRYASQEPDVSHPYGHHRFETFATALLGVFLIVVGIGIGYDSILNLIHKTYETPDSYTVWAAIFSILANEGLFRYSLNIAKQVHSDMLRANAYHNRGDSLSSLIVLVGLVGTFVGFTFLDAVAAIIVAIFILKMGIEWGWKAIYELTEAGVEPELKQKIEKLIWTQPGVKQMHQLRTRKLGGKIFLDVHVLIEPHSSASEGHFIAEVVRVNLQKTFKQIEDVTVHVDTEDHPEGLPEKLLPTRREIMAKYMPVWEKIVPREQVLHVALFYLEQQVQIELRLAYLALQASDIDTLKTRFQQTVAQDETIGALEIMFS